jgi:ornithine cyclodeaminase/alanine dehydrogenase-like protein (mu-crystallin family)
VFTKAILLDRGYNTVFITAATGTLAASLFYKKISATGIIGTGMQAKYNWNTFKSTHLANQFGFGDEQKDKDEQFAKEFSDFDIHILRSC